MARPTARYLRWMNAGPSLDRIEVFLRSDPALHAYELGDLDPWFATHTRWFAAPDTGPVQASALLYTASDPPTLLCFGAGPARALLAQVADRLPARVYAHLSPGLVEGLPAFEARSCGRQLKMAASGAPPGSDHGIEPLGPERASELLAFYDQAHPHHWFDPRMLALEPYVGIREEGELVAAAGLHVWSPARRVAALGNVAVSPSCRGRGLGTRVTGALVRRLAPRADTLALNVAADNPAALSCYRRLGFAVVAEYDELELVRRDR